MPEKITGSVMYCSNTVLETVLAIPNSPIMYLEIKKATKLKNAAHKTAWNGERTFVDTIVAIEFAESWNPLMKSKRNASTIMVIKRLIFFCFYAYLTIIVFMILPTFSAASVAFSSSYMISFNLMISIPFFSFSNKLMVKCSYTSSALFSIVCNSLQ